MGTYFGIDADVALDDVALRALRTCPSWSWVGTGFSGDLPLVRCEAGGGRLVADRAVVRNLGRHLVEDLAMCALAGDVTGTVTITCSDGANELFVARYGPNGAAVGSSECLAAASVPLVGAQVAVVPLGAVTGTHHLVYLVPDGVPAGEMAPVAVHPGDCGCGGWDERFEIPVCHRFVPSRLGARGRELPGAGRHLLDAWVAAIVDPELGDVDTELWSFEPLAAALLDRRADEGLEPVGGDELAAALGHAPRSTELFERIGAHPSLTDELAVDTKLVEVVPATLAANRALSDAFVATLPAHAVAEGALWRLARDVVGQRVAEQLAPASPLTAGQLADVLAALGPAQG